MPRMTVAVVVALLLMPATARSQSLEDRALEVAADVTRGGAIVVHALDIVWTNRCVSEVPGCYEANPTLRWADGSTTGLTIAKMTFATATLYAAHTIARRDVLDSPSERRKKLWLEIGFNAVQIVAIGLIAKRGADRVREARR